MPTWFFIDYFLRVFLMFPFTFSRCCCVARDAGRGRNRSRESRNKRPGLTDRYRDLETPRRLITPRPPSSADPHKSELRAGCDDADVHRRVKFSTRGHRERKRRRNFTARQHVDALKYVSSVRVSCLPWQLKVCWNDVRSALSNRR